MSHPNAIRLVCFLMVMTAMVSLLSLSAQTVKLPDPDQIFWMKTPVSLGADQFLLNPAGRKFFLLSCLEDRRFNHLQVSRVRNSPFVIDAAGRVWKNYPDEVTFRVTATAIDSGLLNTDTDTIDEAGDLNSFLLGLQFRLKAFRGLKMHVEKPLSIKQIGVPADVPYDERVYRVSFETGDLPVDARLVMEVLSPKGQLLSRFHLELE